MKKMITSGGRWLCSPKTGLLVASMLCSFAQGSAQGITSPDTVNVGTAVAFGLNDTENKYTSFAWEFENSSFTPVFDSARPIPNTSVVGDQFALASGACMVYDPAKKGYYAFVTCASNGFNNPNVQRLEFGANPANPAPVVVNLGNPGSAFITNNTGYHNMEDIKIVMDDNGVFHAFISNGGLVHWVFGNGLSNVPTVASRIFANFSVLSLNTNLAVVQYNGSWHLFAGQTSGAPVRFDLGSNLNNIPAAIPYQIFSTPAGYPELGYFALVKEQGQWYMNMSALQSGSPLLKYSFGTNLLNNNPATSIVTLTGPSMNNNRGLNVVKTCDTLYMLGMNQGGTLFSFNYQNNIANTPVAQNRGQLFSIQGGYEVMRPYWYNDTLWAITTSYANSPSANVFRIPLAKINGARGVTQYYDAAAAHTYAMPGVYDVSLYCDQADNGGPRSYCKTIVVRQPVSAIQELSSGNLALRVFPNPATDMIQVILPDDGRFSYTISNMMGQQLGSAGDIRGTKGTSYAVNLKALHLASGMYVIRLRDGAAQYTSRFVVK